jgi:hypothetical protein
MTREDLESEFGEAAESLKRKLVQRIISMQAAGKRLVAWRRYFSIEREGYVMSPKPLCVYHLDCIIDGKAHATEYTVNATIFGGTELKETKKNDQLPLSALPIDYLLAIVANAEGVAVNQEDACATRDRRHF